MCAPKPVYSIDTMHCVSSFREYLTQQQMRSQVGRSPNLLYSIGKRRILTPQAAQTHKPILMKLEVYDYVRDPTPQEKNW